MSKGLPTIARVATRCLPVALRWRITMPGMTAQQMFVACLFVLTTVGCVSQKDRQLAVPDTISEEARAFLVRTKGDIISNYILENGEFVLDRIYREGEPSLQLTEDELGGVKAFWVSSTKASGDEAVVVYFHGGGYVEGDGKSDGAFILPFVASEPRIIAAVEATSMTATGMIPVPPTE